MKKTDEIDFQKLLFKPLSTDYNRARSENKLTAQLNLGFDRMEASLKFLTILTLSVLKKEDEKKYKEVFSSFRTRSTLGNYYFLLLGAMNVSIDSSLYKTIQSILLSEFKNHMGLDLPSDILNGENHEKKLSFFIQKKDKKPHKINNLFLYALNMRNVMKGHSATFKEEDRMLSIRILKNLDLMLRQLHSLIQDILNIEHVSFSADQYMETVASNPHHKKHKFRKVIMHYGNTDYALSPMLAYIDCNIYSCREKHRSKIFFINEVENSKSYYLDYLFNHHWRINTAGNDWKINTFQKDVKNLFEEVKLAYSNENKYTELVSNFVGRQKELDALKSFILDHYSENTISIVTGKPGIGKSSYVTKLQGLISEEKDDLLTYLFYAIKNQNTDNELKYFTDSLAGFLQKNNIINRKELKKIDSDDDELTLMMKALARSDKTLLLIIDGLDELNNAVAFLQNLQFSKWKQDIKIHIVLTSRPYKNILKTLTSVLLDIRAFHVYNQSEVEREGYSFALDSLSTSETQLLIQSLIPKEINVEDEQYNQIMSTIIEKSECLPIYIHYISQNLKDHDLGVNENYMEALLNWSNKLPKKLENYYLESFKDVKSLSRKILIVMFYSPYGISMDELYLLLSPEHMDKIEFEQAYFLPIEMFLRELENNIFGFYHLSVKDAIFNYYIQLGDVRMFSADAYIGSLVKENDNMALLFKDSGYEEEIDHLFSEIYEMDSQGDYSATLKNIIDTGIEQIEDQRLERFFSKSFFTMYYTYCVSLILSIEDVNIMSIDAFNMDLIRSNATIQKEIGKFFMLFEKYAPKDNTEIIASAYKLAKMVGDIQKVLKYHELYMRANLETFIRICSDISNPKHIEEFKEKDV